jgi:hypothetical protein
MKIRLLARDSKMPNIALMQISTHHKRLGDDVDWYNPLLDMYDTDLLYESQLFDFTERFDYYPDCLIVKGGTGIDIKKRLPKEIDSIRDLDYSLYPECDYSMQFYSRGCIRQCPFCVVHDKEGYIQSGEPYRLNSNGKHIEILDNNFFANPDWKEAVKDILRTKQKVNLHGVDVRIMDDEQAAALNKLKHDGQIHIAWDLPQMDLRPKLQEVTKWIKPYKLMCYVLIGYDSTPEQDLYRVETLRELQIDPFVMPFNKADDYQRNFARWANFKAIFKTVKWEEYRKVNSN